MDKSGQSMLWPHYLKGHSPSISKGLEAGWDFFANVDALWQIERSTILSGINT
jgi:hypothetical protein